MHHTIAHGQRIALPYVVLLAIVVAFLASFTLSSTAQAQQGEIGVDIFPSSVDLPATGQVQVEVVVSNLSGDTFQNVRLSWFSNTNVQAVGDMPPLRQLVPGAQNVWNVQLATSGNELLPGTGEFRVDYLRPRPGQPGLISRVAFGTLPLKSFQPQAIEQAANVQVITSLTTLNQQQPGKVYLAITDNSDFPLLVQAITPKGPAFINFEFDGPHQGLSLAPRQSSVVTIDASVQGAVQPGTYVLVFEVASFWQGHLGNIVATKQVDVGVLGVTPILTLLNIPSLLVLPGFLALITMKIIAALGLKAKTENVFLSRLVDLIKVTQAEFWVLAITLSGLVAFIYPSITAWLYGVPRNYLEGYDILDLVTIWLGSIVFAGIIYVVIVGLFNFIHYLRTRYLFTGTETALETLRKLQGRHVNFVRTYARVGEDDNAQYVFLLEPLDGSQKEVWACPAVGVKWLPGNTQALQDAVNGYLTFGNNKQLPEKNAKQLLDLLERELEQERRDFVRNKKPLLLDVDWGELRKDHKKGVFKVNIDKEIKGYAPDRLMITQAFPE